MKKLLGLFLFTLFFVLSTEAQVGLRTASSIQVNKGFPTGTNIIADDQGFFYMEMTPYVLIQKRDEQGVRFTGEILPPVIINEENKPYLKKPKGRMRPIIIVEIASDTLESLSFLDYYTQLPYRERLRLTSLETDVTDLQQRARVIIPLFKGDDKPVYGQPILWEFLGTDENNKEQWERIGGVTEPSPDDEVDLYTANITGTGVYVLFDEDPAPSTDETFIPYSEIELAPTAPYQSVSPRNPQTPPSTDPENTINPTDPNAPGNPLLIDYSSGEVNIPIYDLEGSSGSSNPVLIEPTQNFETPPLVNPLQAGTATPNTINSLQRGTFNPDGVNTQFGIPSSAIAGITGSSFSPPPLQLDSSSNIDAFLNDENDPDPLPDLLDNSENDPRELTESLPIESQTSNIDNKTKVDQLILERLLGDGFVSSPALSSSNNINNEEAVENPTVSSEVSDLLTAPSISEVNIPLESVSNTETVQSSLLANSFGEPRNETIQELYGSAEKPLPKTGNNIWNWLSPILVLLGLGTLYWFKFRKRAPEQLSLKIKK